MSQQSSDPQMLGQPSASPPDHIFPREIWDAILSSITPVQPKTWLFVDRSECQDCWNSRGLARSAARQARLARYAGLDNVTVSLRCLRALVQTSRALRCLAEPRLYEAVYITSGRILAGMLLLLDARPERRRWVRRLYVLEDITEQEFAEDCYSVDAVSPETAEKPRSEGAARLYGLEMLAGFLSKVALEELFCTWEDIEKLIEETPDTLPGLPDPLHPLPVRYNRLSCPVPWETDWRYRSTPAQVQARATIRQLKSLRLRATRDSMQIEPVHVYDAVAYFFDRLESLEVCWEWLRRMNHHYNMEPLKFPEVVESIRHICLQYTAATDSEIAHMLETCPALESLCVTRSDPSSCNTAWRELDAALRMRAEMLRHLDLPDIGQGYYESWDHTLPERRRLTCLQELVSLERLCVHSQALLGSRQERRALESVLHEALDNLPPCLETLAVTFELYHNDWTQECASLSLSRDQVARGEGQEAETVLLIRMLRERHASGTLPKSLRRIILATGYEHAGVDFQCYPGLHEEWKTVREYFQTNGVEIVLVSSDPWYSLVLVAREELEPHEEIQHRVFNES